MPQRDYYVMSGNTTVAKWENNELTVINDSLLPLYLKRVHNADMWLETRAIDSHRANSRLLKKRSDSRKRTISIQWYLSMQQPSPTIIGLSRLTASLNTMMFAFQMIICRTGAQGGLFQLQQGCQLQAL